MRPNVIDLEGENFGRPALVNFLKSLIGARVSAQQVFFSEMRKQSRDAPLLDAGVQFAEALAKQRNEQARRVIDRLNRSRPRRPAEQYQPEEYHREAGERAAEAQAPEGQQSGGRALRVAVPYGTRSISVPIQLRNHRQTDETITLSAVAPSVFGITTIPPEFIQFRPQTLSISPQSEGLTELLIQVDTEIFPPGEYWTEIFVDGADAKRIPFVLKITP